jgi:catechol 2,3-dioxygenase-like lactoylglutathione lyase family enzyme
MKTHLNFATSNLDASVSFYATLLDAQPMRIERDYALFVTEEPPLELALDARATVRPTADAHYGIAVERVDEVDRAIDRLSAAGLVASIERQETCCYANQTKVWAADPEGRCWEVYVVHEETEERVNAEGACCTPSGEERACCAAS